MLIALIWENALSTMASDAGHVNITRQSVAKISHLIDLPSLTNYGNNQCDIFWANYGNNQLDFLQEAFSDNQDNQKIVKDYT